MRARMLAVPMIAAVLLTTGTVSAARAHDPARGAGRSATARAPDPADRGAVRCAFPPVPPAAGSNLQDMLDLNALKRQLAALQASR